MMTAYIREEEIRLNGNRFKTYFNRLDLFYQTIDWMKGLEVLDM